METTITSRHVVTSKELEDYIMNRVNKLDKYFKGIQRLHVILSTEGDQKQAELVMSLVRGKVQTAVGKADTLQGAIDAAHDKAEVQLTRFKEKIRDKR